jgi:hypothetical protein
LWAAPFERFRELDREERIALGDPVQRVPRRQREAHRNMQPDDTLELLERERFQS